MLISTKYGRPCMPSTKKSFNTLIYLTTGVPLLLVAVHIHSSKSLTDNRVNKSDSIDELIKKYGGIVF